MRLRTLIVFFGLASLGTAAAEEGSGTDLAVLLGLRTTGKSFLFASAGRALTRFERTFCPGCMIPSGNSFTYEAGGHATLSWLSFGLTLTETYGKSPSAWRGFVLSLGLGKFR